MRRRRSGQSPSRCSTFNSPSKWCSGMVGVSCSPKRDMSECRATSAWLSSKNILCPSPRVDCLPDVSRRSIDLAGGNFISGIAPGTSELAPGPGGEDVVRNVYRCHAGAFFDELRAWFTKEARLLRSKAEKQLEVDQIKSLRTRVEKLEANTMIVMPTSAGDAAAGGGTSPRSTSPSGRLTTEALTGLDGASLRALCREEARHALEELRSELLGGDLLCDELLSGGAGLRPALERLIAETPTARRESALREQVAELHASVDGAVAAATTAATAEIARLDAAFRSALASEVRDLGSLCEGVKARVEVLDQSAADHIGRLSTRIAELEDARKPPSTFSHGFTREQPRFATLSGKDGDDADGGGTHVRLGAHAADRIFAGSTQGSGSAPAPSAHSERELCNTSFHVEDMSFHPLAWIPGASKTTSQASHQPVAEHTQKAAQAVDSYADDIQGSRSLVASASAPLPPPFCASLAPICIGTSPPTGEMFCAPSTPPKRHVPPASATAPIRTSPGAGAGFAAVGSSRSNWAAGKACSEATPWPSKLSPRIEARGGC